LALKGFAISDVAEICNKRADAGAIQKIREPAFNPTPGTILVK